MYTLYLKMSKHAIRTRVNGMLTPSDIAPSRGYRKAPEGFGSLFVQGSQAQERDDRLLKHGGVRMPTGNIAGMGVRGIKLLDPNMNPIPQGTINIGGWDYVADRNANVKILDATYFGEATTAYEARMERLKQLAKICQCSTAVQREALGQDFVTACAASAQGYADEWSPPQPPEGGLYG